MAKSNLTFPVISYITETRKTERAIRLSKKGLSCFQEALLAADRLVVVADACESMERKYGDAGSLAKAQEFRKITLSMRPRLERLYEECSLLD